jgi:CheY-like chemotaxis protein
VLWRVRFILSPLSSCFVLIPGYAPTVQKTVLLVDDDDTYSIFLPRIFQKAQLKAGLLCVGDGAEAIDYLSGFGKYADRTQFPSPSVILLDLKMPRVNGFEFLEWKNRQTGMEDLPVVVWSSSDLPADIIRAMNLGAKAFFVKPPQMDQLGKVIENLQPYLQDTAISELKPA